MTLEFDNRNRMIAQNVTTFDCEVVRSLKDFVAAQAGHEIARVYRRLADPANPATLIAERSPDLAEQQAAHLGVLFDAEMSPAYFESLRRTVRAEARTDAGVRVHLGIMTPMLVVLFAEIGRRHAWSGAKTARACSALLRWCTIDVLNAFQVGHDDLKHALSERQSAIDAALDQFGQAAEDVESAIQHASEALAQTSARTATAIIQARDAASRTGEAADRGATNLAQTAAASAELVGSIDEVDSLANRSLGAVRETTGSVGVLTGEIGELERAAREIGSVVDLIAAIANQTNLLALNATIEAARAGEAGRGFSVVAAEVKSLAGRTAGATREIATQVAAIQAAATRSAEQLGQIVCVMSRVEEISSAAATATSEQAHATASIADQARAASEAVATIKHAADGVRSLMDTLQDAVAGMDDASHRISDQGIRFRDELGRFAASLTGA